MENVGALRTEEEKKKALGTALGPCSKEQHILTFVRKDRT